MEISAASLFKQKGEFVIIDIRPATAHHKSHLPGSISIPFHNPEDIALLTPILHQHARVCLFDQNGTYVYAAHYPKEVTILKGGISAYKKWLNQIISPPPPIIILGGKTGSGKTLLLDRMEAKGAQHLPLERFANHSGSAFGNLRKNKQPTHLEFLEAIANRWHRLRKHLPVWIEEENAFIGAVGLPESLYSAMLQAPMIEVDIPFEERVENIEHSYLHVDPAGFRQSIKTLAPRLGKHLCNVALNHHQKGRFKACIGVLLGYYDEAYDRRRATTRTGKTYAVPGSLHDIPQLIKKINSIAAYISPVKN